jgi:hypothetical protein
MNLDATSLFLSLITGAIGFVLLAYGKKQGRWPHAVAGLLFMVYPYFTASLTLLIGTGVAISVLLWYVVRIGY